MALINALKTCTMFYNGSALPRQISEVTIPELARKMENYRGGAMPGPVAIDLGMSDDPVTFTWKPGGLLLDVYRDFGATTLDSKLIRWVGSYQDDSTGAVMPGEVVVRGRHSQIGYGTAKPGEMGDHEVTTLAAYYKFSANSRTIIEYDPMNFVLIVDGVDLMAAHRAAMGI